MVISKIKLKLKMTTCHFYRLKDFFMKPGLNIKDL